MKNAVFWDVTPCEFIINRRFGGTCRLHLHGKRINASEEKCQAAANRPMFRSRLRLRLHGKRINTSEEKCLRVAKRLTTVRRHVPSLALFLTP
jgi:hypothetical protein